MNEVSREEIEEKKLKVIRVSIKDDKITTDGKELELDELKSLLEELKPNLVKISTSQEVINETLLAAKSSGASTVFEISY